jgi:hypothetical protein
MIQDKTRVFRLLAIAMPFQNLLFGFSASKIDQMHVLRSVFPFSNQNARIFCIIFTFLSLLSIPFINRHIRSKDAERMRSNHIDPEAVLLVLNAAMLLLPVMCVLFLFFLGLPVNDVNLYAYVSFILMLGLLLQKRRIVWPTAINQSQSTRSVTYTKSYTIVLSFLACIALLFLTGRIMLMINPPPEYVEPFFVSLPWVIIYASIGISCILAVIMRFRNSKNAIELMSLINPLLAFWIPIGTVAYFYWRFKIKHRELPTDIATN